MGHCSNKADSNRTICWLRSLSCVSRAPEDVAFCSLFLTWEEVAELKTIFRVPAVKNTERLWHSATCCYDTENLRGNTQNQRRTDISIRYRHDATRRPRTDKSTTIRYVLKYNFLTIFFSGAELVADRL